MILPGYKVAENHLRTTKRKEPSCLIILTKGNIRTMFSKEKKFQTQRAQITRRHGHLLQCPMSINRQS